MIYDLTWPLTHQMAVYPGDPECNITHPHTHEKDGVQLTAMALGCHTGTHLDVPRHFVASGLSIESEPIERFIGPAAVIAVPWQPDQPLDLKQADWSHWQHGDFVLLSTDWEHRGGTSAFFQDIPSFAAGTSEFLIEKGIRLFGLDLPTVREVVRPGFDKRHMHRMILGNGMIIVEGLNHLSKLIGQRVQFSAVPLLIPGADGSPVRAYATVL
ncbi:MAG: cyclase family protein [Eubacteriales bacterium]|nr:cyclase family protein [Eubacteriales bacterium]